MKGANGGHVDGAGLVRGGVDHLSTMACMLYYGDMPGSPYDSTWEKLRRRNAVRELECLQPFDRFFRPIAVS